MRLLIALLANGTCPSLIKETTCSGVIVSSLSMSCTDNSSLVILTDFKGA